MEAIGTAMTGLATDVITIMGTVGAAAVGVLALFLGWRYGKAIFGTVSRG